MVALTMRLRADAFARRSPVRLTLRSIAGFGFAFSIAAASYFNFASANESSK